MPKPISSEALAVLSLAIVDGSLIRLTSPNLVRSLYLEVNAVLEALGGKWSRSAKAHLFTENPNDALERVLLDGVFADKKRDLDQFFTPEALAMRVVHTADVKGRSVLEPSAGIGSLADECDRAGARSLTLIEKDPTLARTALRNITRQAKTFFFNGDFLEWNATDYAWFVWGHSGPPFERTFERIVMNPPFSRQQDIIHVIRALELLATGGRLVAIMSAGVTFRQDRRTTDFREVVERRGGTIEPLPEKSFAASNTNVRTVLVTIPG